MNTPDDSPLQFPCRFPIKAVGHAEGNFDALVVEIVQRHVAVLHEGAVQTRPSQGGKYLAVTVVIEAQSREQLDNIYRELSGHERVLFAI